jgi:hypothetical protein
MQNKHKYGNKTKKNQSLEPASATTKIRPSPARHDILRHHMHRNQMDDVVSSIPGSVGRSVGASVGPSVPLSVH